METQTNTTNWLEEEAKKLQTPTTYEDLPSLKLTPNVIADIIVDFSKPFKEWTGEANGKSVVKKIIPVSLNGTKMNWWLNIRNPVYGQVITAGAAGQVQFKVLQTGTQQNTKYVLVK